ncbi:hypothetical protein GCM10009678_55010 [Actinomadura kijaniata]|uniref:Uncharacterized protein n=1 Tax=Actinomadura namibiensis TaxID=182080 RepID=A0A7W3LRF5_ACTNM|nr:hypothetical protein [Actinomadura namibiensis]MBA8952867.1 hypothetical protein [Actinomadura namibiensis]
MAEALDGTAARKGWSLVVVGWIGFPLVLFVLLATEDTAGWWRWPVAVAGFGFFVCVAVGLVRLKVHYRGGHKAGLVILTLWAAFPVLVLLPSITPARTSQVESCRVSELKPTRELWLRQEYRVACPSGTREVVYKPSPRAKMADGNRQVHAIGKKVWVSSPKGGTGNRGTFVHSPGSGRFREAGVPLLLILGLMTAIGLWRVLFGPKRPASQEEGRRSPADPADRRVTGA